MSLGLRALLHGGREATLTVNAPYRSNESGFTFTTWNVGLSESNIMNQMNGLPSTRARVEDVASYICKQRGAFWLLQEGFAVEELQRHLFPAVQRKGYSVCVGTKLAKTLGFTGGLVILSRYPIVDSGYFAFTNAEKVDARSYKGVLAVICSIGEGKYICVANTHMQAGFSGTAEEKTEKRRQQFLQAKRFLSDFVEKSKYTVVDVVFGGDFNVGRFTADGPRGVKPMYDWPSMQDGLLDEYRHMTAPGVKKKGSETGTPFGTAFDTRAPSFHYFIEAAVLKVLAHLREGAPRAEEVARETVKLVAVGVNPKSYLKERGLSEGKAKKVESWAKIAVKEVEEQVYRKPDVLDHITLRKADGGLLEKKASAYHVGVPAGRTGVLSDHAPVQVTLEKKKS